MVEGSRPGKASRERWIAPIEADECRVASNDASAVGLEVLNSLDVVESHDFVLSALLPGRAREIAMAGCLGSLCTWLKEYVTGFSRQQFIRALQMFVSYVIFLCIVWPGPVNSALWYNGALPPELGLIFVLMFGVTGGSVGTNTLLEIYSVAALVITGLISVLIRYIVWLASGQDWTNNDFAKAAAFSLLIAFACGCFNILRWKWDVTNAFFSMCSVYLIFMQGPYSGPKSGTLYLLSVHMLVNTTIATTLYTIVSWVLLPIYSSQEVRRSTSKAIEHLGSALLAERDVIMSPVDPESGLFEEATGKRDPLTGRDYGLFPKCEKIYDNMRKSRRLLLSTKGLRLPSLLEIDLYQQTGQYVFPIVSYIHVEYSCFFVLSMISNLNKPIKTGTLSMRMFQNEGIRLAFDALMESLCNVAEALAHSVNDPRVTHWEDVDQMVDLAHQHWIEYLRAGQQAIKLCETADDSFAVRSISIFLYHVGARLRELYFATAVAVCREDPDALRFTFTRLRKRPSWLAVRIAYDNVDKDPLELIRLGQEDSDGYTLEGSKSFEEMAKDISEVRWIRSLRSVLSSEFGFKHTYANMKARSVFRIPLWFIIGLQYFVTVLIAAILNTIPAVQSKVFNNRGSDVLIAVVLTWQPTIGSLTSRAFNLVVGTGMAAAWSYMMLGITYGVTGATWDNSAQKWIVAGFLGATWGAFCVLNAARYKSYSFMWFTSGFTVSLVCLSLMREASPPWEAAGQRLLNVIYGIFISWAVALVLFPISAWRVARGNCARSCSALSDAVASIPDLFEAVDDVSLLRHTKERIVVTPLTKLEMTHGIAALYEALSNTKLSNSLQLAIKARRLIENVIPIIGLAEKEVIYLRRPKQIPKGRIDVAARTINLFISYMLQILSVKLEHHPQSDWKVLRPYHEALTKAFRSLAQSLKYLDSSIHTQGKGTDMVISSLQEAATHVEGLATAAKTILQNFQTLSEGKQDARAPLQNAEIVVVYLGFTLYLQLKIIVLAACEAFVFTNPEAMAMVEKHVAQDEDFLSHARHGPEQIVSELMDDSLSSPYRGKNMGIGAEVVSDGS
eukprot:jgi/Picsp_1/6647/NSC_03990-R1_---NA---